MKPELTHLIHGFKTALAAILAYVITLAFHLEFGCWAVISTVIVMQVYVADSVDLCLYRLSGTLIGAAMGVGVLAVSPRTPVWTGVALFVSVAVCTFLTRYRTRYRMAAITLVIILMTVPADADIFIFGLDRVFEIAIGILCAFLVSVLVFPRRKADMLRQRMVEQAGICADLADRLVSAFINRQQNVEEDPVTELVDSVRKNSAFFISIRRHETRIYNLGQDFQPKVLLLARTAENLRNMARILNSVEAPGHEIILAKEMSDLSRVSGTSLKALVKGDPNCPLVELKLLVTGLEEKLKTIRNEGLTTRFDLRRLVQVFSFYNSLKYLAEDILAESDKLTVS